MTTTGRPRAGPPPTALVVHESMFGNTSAVSVAVARGLREAGYAVTEGEVNRVPAAITPDFDLVVLGAPTHAFSLSRPATRADAGRQGASEGGKIGLREWIARMPHAVDRHMPVVAVFDTRVTRVRRLPRSAATRAVTVLGRKGYRFVDRPVGFLVEDISGPLVTGELERAADWGRRLAGRLTVT